MSELQFPKNPVVGQQYDFPPYRYYWDGIKWKTMGIGYNPVNDLRDEVLPTTREALRRSYAEAGLTLVAGSFEEGATVTLKTEVVWQQATGKVFAWFQDAVKTVGARSSPETTGGIGAGAWVDRSDATIRSELNSDVGSGLVCYKKSGAAWAVKRSLQEIMDASHVDLTGVSSENIQTALDYCYALSEYSTVKLPKTLSLSDGLVVRVDKVRLVGPCILDFSSMPSGTLPDYNYALTLTASTNPPYRQTHEPLIDIEIIGPDKAAQTCGIRYNSDFENSSVSHIALRNVNIHGFAEGEMYQNQAYIITHYNCDIWGNTRAILHDAGYADYGERISYVGCTIFNNDRILDANNPNGGIHFENCSLDYNTDFGEVDAGYVKLTDCHVEMATYTQSYFQANGVGAAIDMEGGWLLCTGTGPHNSDSFAYAAAGSSVRIRPTIANNMQNVSNRWGKGDGYIDVDIYDSYSITQNPTITADLNNLLADGGFDSTVVVDDIFIIGDTATITSRTTGANINISTSTDTYRNAPRALKAVKTYGAGNSCIFVISTRIKEHARVGAELWYKKMDSASGTMYVNFCYGAGYKVDSNGVPSFAKTKSIGLATVSFSSSAEDWTLLSLGEPLSKSPSWATHFFIEINMDNKGAGAVYFDDTVITDG